MSKKYLNAEYTRELRILLMLLSRQVQEIGKHVIESTNAKFDYKKQLKILVQSAENFNREAEKVIPDSAAYEASAQLTEEIVKWTKTKINNE